MRYLAPINVLICFALLMNLRGQAGDSQGNGGDQPLAHEGAAWYLGQEPIKYCIVLSEDFGRTQQDVESDIEQAFKIWQQYIEDKKVNNPEYTGDPMYNGKMFRVGQFSLWSKATRMSECDHETELIFYLGVENEDVLKAKKRYHNPTAFAHKSSYDGKSGRGKGFIWVVNHNSFADQVPNWNDPYKFLGIILHEIGHVLGNRHIKNTIMDGEIGRLVLAPNIKESVAKSFFTVIDSGKELYFCERCSSSFKGDSSHYEGFEDLLEPLIGRKTKGKVTTHLVDKREKWFLEDYRLLIKDDLGEFEFSLENTFTSLARNLGDAEVFKKAANMSLVSDYIQSVSLSSDAVSSLKSIRIKDKQISVVLNRNMGIRAATLSLLEKGGIFIFLSESSDL